MKKGIWLVFVLFLITPSIVKAVDYTCTSAERNRLQSMVNTVQLIYEFDDDSKTYNIIVNGLTYDFYIANPNDNLYVRYDDNSTVTLSGYVPGKTYNFPFYASQYSTCNDVFIITKAVYLPPYNAYSEDPLCLGYEDFELCKKFSPIKVNSYDEFIRRLNKYIADQKKEPEPEPEPEPEVNVSLWSQIMEFLLNYNLFILIPIIVLGTAGIILIEVRKRRSIL